MKKLVVIVLSTLLFFNSSLFIIIYGVRIIGITRDVNEKIQFLNADEIAGETVLIKTTLADPTLYGTIQKRNDKEILYNGFLFDIAYQRIVGDTLYIFCLQDNEEDELLKNIVTHFENESNKNPEMQYFNLLFTFLSNALIPNETIIIPSEASFGSFECLPDRTCRGMKIIPAPPPRNLV